MRVRGWIAGDGFVALALGVLVALGAALRISQLDQGLFGDELWTYVGSTNGLGDAIDFVESDQEITPPLYTILAWLSAQAGDPTIWIRIPALLGGILTIPLTYALAIESLRSRFVALLAATLTALSGFMIFHSVEARAYGLVIALVAASTLSLLRAVETKRTRWWVAYAAFSCAAFYAHYTAAFVLLAQLGWCLYFHRDVWRPALLANMAAAVFYLPWVPGFLDDLESPTQQVYERLVPFSLDYFVDFTVRFAVGHPGVGLNDYLGSWGEAVLLLGLAAAVAGAIAARFSGRASPSWLRGRWEALILLILLALAAPLGAGFLSLVGNDLFIPRNLGVSWPALAVAIAALVATGPAVTRVIATALVVGAFAYGAIESVTEDELKRPAYRDAGALIDRETGPDDVVLDVNPIFVGGGAAPPALTLDVHLDEPHVNIHYIEPPDGREALRAASGRRLALAGHPLFVEAVRAGIGLSETEPVAEESYAGALPAVVEVFEIPAADHAPSRNDG